MTNLHDLTLSARLIQQLRIQLKQRASDRLQCR